MAPYNIDDPENIRRFLEAARVRIGTGTTHPEPVLSTTESSQPSPDIGPQDTPEINPYTAGIDTAEDLNVPHIVVNHSLDNPLTPPQTPPLDTARLSASPQLTASPQQVFAHADDTVKTRDFATDPRPLAQTESHDSGSVEEVLTAPTKAKLPPHLRGLISAQINVGNSEDHSTITTPAVPSHSLVELSTSQADPQTDKKQEGSDNLPAQHAVKMNQSGQEVARESSASAPMNNATGSSIEAVIKTKEAVPDIAQKASMSQSQDRKTETEAPDPIVNIQAFLDAVDVIEKTNYLSVEKLIMLLEARDNALAEVTEPGHATPATSGPAPPMSQADFKKMLAKTTKPRAEHSAPSQGETSSTEASMEGSENAKPTESGTGEAVSAGLNPRTQARVVSAGHSTVNREDQVFFGNGWGAPEARDGPVAKVRTVLITPLPTNAGPSFVASVVFCGAVDDITVRSTAAGDLSATVRFINAEDCDTYYEKTANGIIYGKDKNNKNQVVFVERGQKVDVVSGILQSWINQGVSRCVRAVGVAKDWDKETLKKIAEEKGRKLEGMSDGLNFGGHRVVIWRMCNVDDAVALKFAIARNVQFEECNLSFSTDPCAVAVGPHC